MKFRSPATKSVLISHIVYLFLKCILKGLLHWGWLITGEVVMGKCRQGSTLVSLALIIWDMAVQSDPWYLELHPTYSSSISNEERVRGRGVVRMRRRRHKSREVGRIVINGQMMQKAESDMKRTVRGEKKFSLTSVSDIQNLCVIHWIVYSLLPS